MMRRVALWVLLLQSCTHKGYFEPLPIATFSSIGSPTLEVQIEDETLLVELDLGYRGDLAYTRPLPLKKKTFLHEKTMYSVRGKSYRTLLYQIPSLHVGTHTFFSPILQEEGLEFVRDTTISASLDVPLQRKEGRIGWELFQKDNLLLDIPGNTLALVDSISTLQKRGYRVVASTPLLLDRGLVECFASTENKTIRCILDTGATWNFWQEESAVLDASLFDEKIATQVPSFLVGNVEVGPLSFRPLSIQLPIPVDAILGLEFLERYPLFFSFQEKTLYLLSGEKSKEMAPRQM